MLRALRRSRLLSLFAVIALFTVLPAVVPALHDDSDDPLCNPAPVLHDHAAHHLNPAGTPAPAPEHCFICHWFQSLRGATVASRLELPAAQTATLLAPGVIRPLHTIATSRSGRAPPLA